MNNQIPGDGRTFMHHLIVGNFNEIFHHDIPKALGVEKRIADDLKAEWLKLEPTLQNGLLYGAKVMDTIAAGVDKIPADVVAEIEKIVPAEDIDKVKEIIKQVQVEMTGIETLPDENFETTVKNILDYLKTKESGIGRVLSQWAQTIASFFSPNSKFASIIQFIETAYQLIKAK